LLAPILTCLLEFGAVVPVAAADTAPAPSAQLGPDPADSPEVERLVAKGITLRAEGKDLEALEVLKKAAEIDPDSVRVQIHLATVYQALGEWLLADQFLSFALAQENHPYVARHRKALEDAARVIGQNIGRVEVEGGPAGSEVRLNGKLVGLLPLAAPVRATVGSYTLEVRLDGHYTAKRTIQVTGQGLVREAVRLEPLPVDDVAGSGHSAGSHENGDVARDHSASRAWLTWTLAGLGTAAGATTVAAVIYREAHAKHWNDGSRCLGTGVTRAELCGGERDKAEAGQNVAIAAGVATAVFAAGALLNVFAFSSSHPGEQAGLAGCGIGLGGASCFGSF
jgi:tetratricopeptide (TPR) repeat protein